MRISLIVAILVLLSGCGESPPGGTADSGTPPPPRDGAAVFDAGFADAGPDAGVADAGTIEDAGTPDSGVPVDGGPMVGNPCAQPACLGTQVLICGADQIYAPGEDCALRQQRCENGSCTGCIPGTRRCGGSTSVEECDPDGQAYNTVEICPADRVCDEGGCIVAGPCGVGSKKSNQGCDYWAVDLPNADVTVDETDVSPATAQYAVVISNTDASVPATVLITEWSGTEAVTVLMDSVPPQDLKVFELPAKNADQCGTTMGCPHVDYKAYRIQTSVPVVAYQFNPLNNTDEAFSNDASLLLPTNALGQEYLVVTGDAQAGVSRDNRTVSWGAYLSVVGTTPSPTAVTVNLPDGVRFDPPQGATVSGQIVTATLSQYQVLTILSNHRNNERPGEGNLSGARVSASSRVAVFSGNMAVIEPHGTSDARCCADHTEEQIFPLVAWGKEYVAVRSMPKRLSEPFEEDVWRITASVANTNLTYVTNAGSALSGQPTALGAGQSQVFRSRGDFVVTADQPILIAQFMTSSNFAYDIDSNTPFQGFCELTDDDSDDAACTAEYNTLSRCGLDGYCYPVGDPSMTLIPPVRQFRTNYVFLTPLDYKLDYATIIAPATATVTLDGAEVAAAEWQDVGMIQGVTFRRARVVLTTRGRHVLTATEPVGLLVAGYDRDVSYGYPGGLDLQGVAAPPDGGADGGASSDGGATPDGGTADAGSDDAGPPDAGAEDAGVAEDAGPPDAGLVEDAGPPDAGPDAGPEVDAG